MDPSLEYPSMALVREMGLDKRVFKICCRLASNAWCVLRGSEVEQGSLPHSWDNNRSFQLCMRTVPHLLYRRRSNASHTILDCCLTLYRTNSQANRVHHVV